MLAIWQQSSGMRFAMLWSICLLKQRSRSGSCELFSAVIPIFVVVVQFKSEESLTILLLSDCMFFFEVSELQPLTRSYYVGCRENIQETPKNAIFMGCWLGHLGPNHQFLLSWGRSHEWSYSWIWGSLLEGGLYGICHFIHAHIV